MSYRTLERTDAPTLAYVHSPVKSATLPTVVFLSGFRSDMNGTKALYLEEACAKREQPFLRFDYSGHGFSDGAFEDCTIRDWLADALDVLDRVLEGGDCVLVGSSMGGWLALLAARERPERVKGLVLLAAAPDFTRDIREQIGEQDRLALKSRGFIEVPTPYDDTPYVITNALIEESEACCLLDRSLGLSIPVRLIHGTRDADVPWEKTLRIHKILPESDCRILLLEGSDHRLSTERDLAVIDAQILDVCGRSSDGKPGLERVPVEILPVIPERSVL